MSDFNPPRTFTVTQEDIDKGARGNSYICPLALAIKRAIPAFLRDGVCVGLEQVTINESKYGMSLETAKAVWVFDLTGVMSPFTAKIGGG